MECFLPIRLTTSRQATKNTDACRLVVKRLARVWKNSNTFPIIAHGSEIKVVTGC